MTEKILEILIKTMLVLGVIATILWILFLLFVLYKGLIFLLKL